MVNGDLGRRGKAVRPRVEQAWKGVTDNVITRLQITAANRVWATISRRRHVQLDLSVQVSKEGVANSQFP